MQTFDDAHYTALVMGAIGECIRYALLQKLKDHLLTYDDDVRREFLIEHSREVRVRSNANAGLGQNHHHHYHHHLAEEVEVVVVEIGVGQGVGVGVRMKLEVATTTIMWCE